MLYIITYSLNNKSKDYSNLYNKIKENGLWWHYIDSSWIIKSSRDANTIANELLPFIETSDNLLVIKIDPTNKQGWLPKDAWDWINRNS